MTDDMPAKTLQIEFIACHQPALQTGDYILRVEQQVELKGVPDTFFREQDFSVLGPRFTLNPQEIASVFPPPGSLGSHADSLPHVALKRTTLPWERSPFVSTPAAGDSSTAGTTTAASTTEKNAAPWLALLLFDEKEFADQPELFEAIKNPQPMKLQQYFELDARSTPPAGQVHKEETDQLEDDITIIEVPWTILQNALPTVQELKLLAHVRRAVDEHGDLSGEEAAVILCKRPPQQTSTSVVHLVSVEGRYTQQGFIQPGDGPVRLVSLFHWRFACVSGAQTFDGLLNGLNHHVLRLPELQNAGSPVAQCIEQYFAMGCAPLPHRMRQGSQTVSWYHGPLIPAGQSGRAAGLPAQSADLLVRYDPDAGMYDETYAAAWQLGRLMAIQNRPVSVALFNWNQNQARRRHALAAAMSALSTVFAAAGPQLAFTPLPEPVITWLDGLAELKGIPFRYLVPDDRMLPGESIRFFQVDTAWVDCLLDGARSIGRVLPSNGDLPKPVRQPRPASILSGFLLHSDLVPGWPGLIVKGYSDHEGRCPLELRRKELLSRNVLLFLFRGPAAVEAVDLYQKPETVHFGAVTDPEKSWKAKNSAEFAYQLAARSIEKVRFYSKKTNEHSRLNR